MMKKQSEAPFKQGCEVEQNTAQTLQPQEQAVLMLDPIKYINMIQRLDNPRLKCEIHRFEGEFVLEVNHQLIPTYEEPEQFDLKIEGLLPKARFGSEMTFAGIPRLQYEAIIKVFTQTWVEYCYLLTYKGKGFHHLACVNEIDGEDYVLDQLNLADAEDVFEHYMFKDDGIGYIEDIIRNELTFCLRCKGQLLSWVVQREDGSLGIMYTKKNYRRLGLGQILSKHLINAVLKKGQIPYLHIHCDNEASLALAASLDFEIHSEVVWFGVKREA